LGLQVREGMDSPQDLKLDSFKITAIAMDGVSVTETPRLKRGSVRYASAPSTARAGNTDAPLNILRGSGWEPPMEPVELCPLPAFSGQGGALKREAPSARAG
jgi:hypothetical protein